MLRHGPVSGSAAIACALLLSCSAGTSQAHIDSLEPAAPVQFSFRRQDGVEFSSQNSRGRATMVALVTTYDLGSQLLLRRVEEALRAHRPRANAGAIVMEPPKYEVLLDTYAEAMNLSFPMVLSDLATREGRGPFGDVDYLPVLIVLDADGRPVARYEGPVDLQVLLDALAEASPPGRGEL